jgi:hypothetical protein
MATTTGRRSSVKRRDDEAGDEARQVVRDQVEELARAGARQMLLAALEDEVNVYLQRDRYQRQAEFRGYRNGTTPRRLTLGSGTVPLDVPRVRDIPAGQEPFESKILRKYQRRSDTIDETAAGGGRGPAVAQHDQPADAAVPDGVHGVRPAGAEQPEVRVCLGGRHLPEGRAGDGEGLPDGADRGGYRGTKTPAGPAGRVPRKRRELGRAAEGLPAARPE